MRMNWKVDESRTERTLLVSPEHSYRVTIVVRAYGVSDNLLTHLVLPDDNYFLSSTLANSRTAIVFLKRKEGKIAKGIREAYESGKDSGSFDVGLASER